MFRWKTHSSHHRGQVDNKHTDGATSHEQKYSRKKHKKIEKAQEYLGFFFAYSYFCNLKNIKNKKQ